MDLKKSSKKNNGIKYFSKIMISIASIGFVCIAVIDTKISDKNETIDKLNYKFDDLRFDLDQSLREYNRAFDQRNYLKILKKLGVSENVISQANEDFLKIFRGSIILLYHAGMDKHIDQETLKNINNLENYEELFTIYESFLKKAKIRVDEVVKTRLLEEKDKFTIEIIKIWLLSFFILLMVMGFIIEIHLLRKENQNIISNSSLKN